MHKHHIIPKHIGGTDHPSNLIELSVEEHALEHFKLFQQDGRWQDEVAYKALSGMLGKEDIIREIQRNVGKINGTRNKVNGWWSKVQQLGSKAGAKKGAERCRELEVNSFFNPSLRKTAQSKGGKQGGKVNGTQRLATCLNCRKTGQLTVMNRWHFAKCKVQL